MKRVSLRLNKYKAVLTVSDVCLLQQLIFQDARLVLLDVFRKRYQTLDNLGLSLVERLSLHIVEPMD